MLNLNGAGDPLTPGYPAKGEVADLYLDHQVLSKMILKVTVALEIPLVLVQMQREKLLRMTLSSHSFSWCTVDSAFISF